MTTFRIGVLLLLFAVPGIVSANSLPKTHESLLDSILTLLDNDEVEIVTPDDYLGDVTGDMNRRRAILESVTAKVGVQIIKAAVPLSEMFGYVTTLRSITSGRATSSMEFKSYEIAPKGISEEVIKEIKGIIS